MWLVGDLHGSLKEFTFIIEKRDLRNENIIQVGDFGLGSNSLGIDMQNLKILNEILIERNLILYIIRGNHDDPAFWYLHDTSAYSNIIFVKDYSVLNIEDTNILFAGGAVSIDRCYRTINKMPYFKGEEFVLNEERLNLILETEERVDMIVTHNAPMFFEPQGIVSPLVDNYIAHERTVWGTDLRGSLIKERQDIEKMHDILLEKFTIKDWVYGHFHKSFRGIHKNIRSTGEEVITNHILLDIKEFYEHRQNEIKDRNKTAKRTKKTNNKAY